MVEIVWKLNLSNKKLNKYEVKTIENFPFFIQYFNSFFQQIPRKMGRTYELAKKQGLLKTRYFDSILQACAYILTWKKLYQVIFCPF